MVPPKTPNTPRQQTLEATLGRPRVNTVIRRPRNSQANATSRQLNSPNSVGGTTIGSLPRRQQSQLNSPNLVGGTAIGSSPRRQRASFLPRSQGSSVALDKPTSSSSSESAVEDLFDDGEGQKSLPSFRAPAPRSRHKSDASVASGSNSLGRLSSQPRPIVIEDDSDDKPLAPAPSSTRGKLKRKTVGSEGGKEDRPLAPFPSSNRQRSENKAGTSKDVNKDKPVARIPSSGRIPSSSRQTPQKRTATSKDSDKLLDLPHPSGQRNPKKRAVSSEDSDEDDVVQPTKRRRLTRRVTSNADTPSADTPSADTSSANESNHESSSKEPTTPPQSKQEADCLYTLMKRGSRRSAQSSRSANRKFLLYRRRRAGEVISEEDLSPPSEGHRIAMYDTDSDHPALEEFEDDEEGVPANESTSESRNNGNRAVHHGEDDDKMADFIVDDDDGPLGAPAELLELPAQFSAKSHRPLEYQFAKAIEWLVHLKINPTFPQRKHAEYLIPWRKLNDEFRGLAQSKFISSSWGPEFRLALLARPSFTAVEMSPVTIDDSITCKACNRPHPARWVVSFRGAPYHQDATGDHFLEDVDQGSCGEDEDEDEDEGDCDEDGNLIPMEEKEWHMGSVCKSNAETSHLLVHWRHNLLDYVTGALEAQKYMQPAKLEKRKKMTPDQRKKEVEQIIKGWSTGTKSIMNDLILEFKKNLKTAHNKSTTGGRERRW
ncbi:hypothetical protein QBC33DRAFT_353592 [Phialemonium atrogriseum]|uniref:DUF4211 domain-containing protein n=1 Tax=Phialemonium atrogriseum TaxID=1093897 RepID=A0AAJ0FIZ6_9PEZI|nr:uncharacterized protein QBC33DRAFT_353592 [Phialemonium atrogriseum]KAK1769377.1 hypothetical protein QBC33DRAFT_353592 [Phialemonium atrogriseum]